MSTGKTAIARMPRGVVQDQRRVSIPTILFAQKVPIPLGFERTVTVPLVRINTAKLEKSLRLMREGALPGDMCMRLQKSSFTVNRYDELLGLCVSVRENEEVLAGWETASKGPCYFVVFSTPTNGAVGFPVHKKYCKRS